MLDNGAVAFSGERICDVGDFATLQKRYGNARFHENCVLTPALINPHTHIEFSDTRGFVFGSFGAWLSSVFARRQKPCERAQMEESLASLRQSGVGCVGAISSQGHDLDVLADSNLRVVYFNELIGSSHANAEAAWEAFMQRVQAAERRTSPTFHNALAAHAPYSVVPNLLARLVGEANKRQCALSVHFLESLEERQWLCEDSGFFKDFYATFNPSNTQSFYRIESFLEHFAGTKARLLFVHCTQASADELAHIARLGASVVSCPRSNRLLGGKMLGFKKTNAIVPCLIGTDSLASNNSLNLLEELRVALFCAHASIAPLSVALVLAATKNAARALGLDCGILQSGKLADMALFCVPQVMHTSQEALAFLLHATHAKTLWVGGKELGENR
ncbi:MAG: metal-dependent hydrolase [Helicobacter sp.]|nr:metal-dependent hydrolase [Helicobacter sp.]